jgi:hypothetical protein
MSDYTKNQNDFLLAAESKDIPGVEQCLGDGDEELLCVIGEACAISRKKCPQIFELLMDENSPYKILRTYHNTDVNGTSQIAAQIASYSLV